MRLRLAVATSATIAMLMTAAPALAGHPPPIPGAGNVYAGLYSSVWDYDSDLTALGNWVGKKVTFAGTFFDPVIDPNIPWNADWVLEEAWQAGATPFLNVHMSASAFNIAAGNQDAKISALALAVYNWCCSTAGKLASGRSLIIGPMPEMNGYWVPYGLDPGNFKLAYYKFYDIFRFNYGLKEDKVRFAFVPNGWTPPNNGYQMADYYPGAPYVDVVGISAYNFGIYNCPTDPPPGGCGWEWPSVAFNWIGAVRNFAPEKPFFIAQTASTCYKTGTKPSPTCTRSEKDNWLTLAFSWTANDPNVVGIIYFNISKPNEFFSGVSSDWPVWYGTSGNPNNYQGFKTGMLYSTTRYDAAPLSDWFKKGPLPFPPFTPPFKDDEGSIHEPDIHSIWSAGITGGCTIADVWLYCPNSVVTRAQMAVFIDRAADLHIPYPSPPDAFTDDNAAEWDPFELSINRMAADGITTGCGGSNYCPASNVTRAQMAVFIDRAANLPNTGIDFFTDDNASIWDPYEPSINRMAAAGITTGCGGSNYCPANLVSRAQMATFLKRAFL